MKQTKTTVIGGPAGTPVVPSPPTPQQVRIHENEGQVHFHVDAEDLKVAVPTTEWYSAWNVLSKQPGEVALVDKERGTVATVSTGISNGILDARIEIKKAVVDAPGKIGSIFAELDRFTNG